MGRSGLKIAVIGGGSSYTPELIEGFIKRNEELPVSELWLVDVSQGREKLETIAALARRMVEKAGVPIRIMTTEERDEALDGADFVVTQFRVGGLEARIRDERIPLKYGSIGQETTGPGGFAKALRTIPVILDLCRDMERLCPDAWLINFTNPSGIVTQTILTRTPIKAIGLCNVPISMRYDVAEGLGMPLDKVYCDFIGLNHLVWASRIEADGRDVTADVVGAVHEGASTMTNIPNLSLSAEFMTSLGMLPCDYLKYYYLTDELLAECRVAADGEGVRGEVIKGIEEELFEMYRDPDLAVKPPQLEKRGGAHYSDAACALISSIYNDRRDIQVVNVLNGDTTPDLAPDAVIERNSHVGADGATPIPFGALPPQIRGLVQLVKAYEELTIQAAVDGDRAAALQALTIHPLVASATAAQGMLDEIIEANAEYLPRFV